MKELSEVNCKRPFFNHIQLKLENLKNYLFFKNLARYLIILPIFPLIEPFLYPFLTFFFFFLLIIHLSILQVFLGL